MGYRKHFLIDHGKDEFAKAGTHRYGIEGFGGIVEICLTKSQGLPHATFDILLKESEWR